MGKFIFWIIVVFVVLFGLRLMNAANGKSREREARGGAKGAGPREEPMVRCSSCGVFLPRSEAREAAGGYVCGDPTCVPRR
jgi:hypothetical protein